MPTLTLTVPCDGCCTPKVCHDIYGDVLDVVLAGFTKCPCPAVDGVNFEVQSNSVAGAFSALWSSGLLRWECSTGIITVQFYSDPCVTPDGGPAEFAPDLQITCADNLFTVRLFDPITGSLMFGNSVPQPLGVILNDMATCDGSTSGTIASITLSTP